MNVEYWVRVPRLICPASGRDMKGSVGVAGDRIAALQPDPGSHGGQPVFDFPNTLLLPGLIDLHAHPATSGSMYGVDPDQHLLNRGTTTVMSQGDAGADYLTQYIEETIERCQTQIVLALNLSSRGEAGPGGCFSDLSLANVPACIAALKAQSKHIWGLAVNTSHNACGSTDPREILRRGIRVAEECGVPILYGMRRPEDWPLAEQLKILRPGDVVTYCFRSTPHCIVQDGQGPHHAGRRRGEVLPEVLEARERGVRFDVGHGSASFSFRVAEQAIEHGFYPDTISTDLQKNHLGKEPTHDLPLVMSKLRAVGMSEQKILAAVTAQPANILRMSHEIGSLETGSLADMTILAWQQESIRLSDVHGDVRFGGRWSTVATIRKGVVFREIQNGDGQQLFHPRSN